MTLKQLKIFTGYMKSIKTEMIDKSYHSGGKNFSLKESIESKSKLKSKAQFIIHLAHK